MPSAMRLIVGLLFCCGVRAASGGPTSQPTRRPANQTAARPAWVPTFAGPWDDAIAVLSLGDDGKTAAVCRENIAHGSGPTICAGKDGALTAYFEFYSFDRKADFGCIGRSESRDHGKTWAGVTPITISGIAKDAGRPRQPAAVTLPDGRVRLYFTLDPRGGCSVIGSALSKDGRSFEYEPEPRLSLADSGVFDATAIQAGSDTHLFARTTGQPNVLVHASAKDGLKFVRLPDVRLDVATGAASDSRYSTFVATRGGGRLLVSADGLNWAVATSPVLPTLRDLAAARLDSKGWLLLAVIDRSGGRSGELVVGRSARDRMARALEPKSDDARADPQSASAEGDPAASTGETAPDAAGAYPPIEELLPPPPNFVERVDYAEWVRRNAQSGKGDDAAPYYEEILVRIDEDGAPTSAVAPLVNMLSTLETEHDPRPWLPSERPEWEQVYQDSRELLAKYRAATEHNDFATILRFGQNDGTAPPLLTALLPDLKAHRGIVKQTLANGWRAEDGRVDPNAMMDSWATSLRSANHLGHGFTMIEQLVGTAESNVTYEMARQALAQGVIPPEQLGTALEVLRQNAPVPRDPAALVSGELAFSLDLVQFVTDPPGADGKAHYNPDRVAKLAADLGNDPPQPAELNAVLARDPAEAASYFRNYYVEMAGLMRKGYPEVNGKTIDDLAEKRTKEHSIESMILPALGRYHALRARNEASNRATQLAFAVQVFKNETGRYPASLSELPPDLAGVAKTDPFTGKDFLYRVGANGPVIYTASENGKDDGGVHAPRWGDDKDVEVNSDDFVFWPPQPRPPRK